MERELSHLDSTTVGRYRSLLVKNDFLEQRLALLTGPVLRKILIGGILCLCVVLLYFFVVEQGLSRLFYLAFATAILVECLLRFKREHAIVGDCGKAVGTVLEHKRLGARRGARIKYGFLSADNKLHVGNVGGTPFMPKEGQSVPIVYKLEDPSISLPLSSFWFYEFPVEFYRSTQSEQIPVDKAPRSSELPRR